MAWHVAPSTRRGRGTRCQREQREENKRTPQEHHHHPVSSTQVRPWMAAIWNVEPQSWPTLVMRSCAWAGSTTIFVATRPRTRAGVTGRVGRSAAAPVASAATAILAMANWLSLTTELSRRCGSGVTQRSNSRTLIARACGLVSRRAALSCSCKRLQASGDREAAAEALTGPEETRRSDPGAIRPNSQPARSASLERTNWARCRDCSHTCASRPAEQL